MRYVAEFKESVALDDVPTVFSEAKGIPHTRIKRVLEEVLAIVQR